jgi:phage tail-like protein
MATKRETPYGPYGAFNFLVQFTDVPGGGGPIDAGFSDVSGLGNEINYSDYREGDFLVNTTTKVPNTNKTDEVTFKRGLIGSPEIFKWFSAVRDGAYQPITVTIVLLDEARNDVLHLVLKRVQPKKWVGPTLAAKGGGEVAMEELHVVFEEMEYT